MTEYWHRWAGTRPPDNPDKQGIGYLYSVLHTMTEDLICELGNDTDMAPFKPFAESAAAAWNEINSCPLSSLPLTGDLIEKYESLLNEAVDSIRSGDVNMVLKLSHKMDRVLKHLKQRLAQTIAGRMYREFSLPRPINLGSGANSMFSGAKGLSIDNSTFNITADQAVGTVQAITSVVSHPMGVSTSMFAGATNVRISNCTFNTTTGQPDTA